MPFLCFHCGRELDLPSSRSVGRSDTCPHCDSDIHCCLNCAHYDETAYNQCHESQAERVLDKDRANFCDYFTPSPKKVGQLVDDKAETLKKLNDLFR